MQKQKQKRRPRQIRLVGTGPEPKQRGSETRQATRIVPVRFTPEGFDQVTAAASQAGYKSRSEFLRVLGLGPGRGSRGDLRSQIDRAELVRLLAELGKIGSNVNQIARAVNASGGDELPQAATLADVQHDLAETFEAVRKALGRR